MLLYSSRSSCLYFEGDTFHFGDISFGILRVNYMVWMAWLSFQTYSCQVWKHGFHSSHSEYSDRVGLTELYLGYSELFWFMIDRVGLRWQQYSALDHHSKPRDTDSFSAQRMLGSSCWGQRPMKFQQMLNPGILLTPGAQVWSVPWRSGAWDRRTSTAGPTRC